MLKFFVQEQGGDPWGTGAPQYHDLCSDCSGCAGIENAIIDCVNSAAYFNMPCFPDFHECMREMLLPSGFDVTFKCSSGSDWPCDGSITPTPTMYTEASTGIIFLCPNAIAIYQQSQDKFCMLIMHELIHLCESKYNMGLDELDAYALANYFASPAGQIWPTEDSWLQIGTYSSPFYNPDDPTGNYKKSNLVIVDTDTGEIWCVDPSTGGMGQSLGTFPGMAHTPPIPTPNT